MDRRGHLLLWLPWGGFPDDAVEPATNPFAAGPALRRLPGRPGTLFVPSDGDGLNGRSGGRCTDPVRSRVLARGGAPAAGFSEGSAGCVSFRGGALKRGEK